MVISLFDAMPCGTAAVQQMKYAYTQDISKFSVSAGYSKHASKDELLYNFLQYSFSSLNAVVTSS